MTPVTMPAYPELLLTSRADTPDQDFPAFAGLQKNSIKYWTSEAGKKILISGL